MKLKLLEMDLSICQVERELSIPDWAYKGEFFSLTKTFDEISIVCSTELVPNDTKQESGFQALMVEGPLDFSLVGVLNSILEKLKQEEISVFVISTFNTDYILVKKAKVELAVEVLRKAGYCVS